MKSILIIEDDPLIVTALEIRFRSSGYTTFTAGDAVSGFSQALQHRPDLIVLDITLPAGDGIQLAQKIRSNAEIRAIPLIFVTANKDPNLRARVMDLGAAGLFDKPYNADELLAVAGHALGETGMFRRPIARFTPAAEESAAPAPSSSRKKILIVEDDEKIARALSLRLKSAGYDTTTASDALSGVNTAVKLRPDLVLLDVSMPAGDGFSVAERLGALLPVRPPIIFLTASKQNSFRRRAEELGAVAYFEKPYESDALLAAVQKHVGI